MWILCSISCVLIATVHGYPFGAPPNACESMMPRHGPSAQMLAADLSDYELVGDAEGYEINQPFPVRIENFTATDQMIHGFLLVARTEGSIDNIGQFTARNSTQERWVQKSCNDTALTHTARLQPLNGLNLIEANWYPPTNFTGRVKFGATVVIHKELFYIGFDTDYVQLIDPRSAEAPAPPPSEAPTKVPEPEDPIIDTETEAPSTEAPETEAPSTEAPESEASTEAAETEALTTGAPETEAPSTEAPESEASSTEEATTETQTPKAAEVNQSSTTEAPNREASAATEIATEAATDALADTTTLDPASMVDVEGTTTISDIDVERTTELVPTIPQVDSNATQINSSVDAEPTTQPDAVTTTLDEVETTEADSTITESEPPIDTDATAPTRPKAPATQEPAVTDEPTVVTDEPTVEVADHTMSDEITTAGNTTKSVEDQTTEKPHDHVHSKPNKPALIPIGNTKRNQDNAGSTITYTTAVLIISSIFALL